MRCIHCGQLLPEDSKFCQYCGEKTPLAQTHSSEETVASVTEEAMAVGIVEGEKAVVAKETRDDLNVAESECGDAPHTSVQTSPDQKQQHEKKTGRKAPLVIAWTLFLVTAVCLCVVLFQNFEIRNQSKMQQSQIAQLQGKLDDLENTVAEQQSAMEEQTTTISMLRKTLTMQEEKADLFDQICSGLRSGKIGRASEDFNVSDGVIILRRGSSTKIKLTTSWSGEGDVGFYTSNDCSTVDFTEDSWYDTTKLSIMGNTPGVTIATFYNTANADTFKILIIVTE